MADIIFAQVLQGVIIGIIMYVVLYRFLGTGDMKVLDPYAFFVIFFICLLFSFFLYPRNGFAGRMLGDFVFSLTYVIVMPGLQKFFPRQPATPPTE